MSTIALWVFFYILILLKKKNKIKSICLFLGLLFFFSVTSFSQQGLTLPANLKKDRIPFELVNNLVIIPVEVNGAQLSFLLDSGVNTTILFGITEVDSLRVNNAKPIKVRGLGDGEGVVALESDNNEVKVGKAVDSNHRIYVVFEETLNFSARMGIPIHGIIGYDFFKNFIVKSDYVSRKLTFYDPSKYNKKNCNGCEEFDLSFHNNKPYMTIKMATQTGGVEEITLLVDSGSSDALWLFKEEGVRSEDPKKSFDDFLGLGFSGNIFGKRSKLDNIWLGKFNLKDVKVAFPEKSATEGIKFFVERDGSIGGDILKRFTVIMDYNSQKMILKKNMNYSDPFFYNMAGLTIEHDGLEVVTELTTQRNFNFNNSSSAQNGTTSQAITDVNVYTHFALVPKYVIVDVRKDSPAELVGLKIGDEIVAINGRPAYKTKLFALNTLFSSKVGKRINLKIKRNNLIQKVRFTLKKVI